MQRIIVVGLGPGSWEGLTVRGWEAIDSARRVFFRTEQHPVVQELKNRGLCFTSFDYLYEEKPTFEDVYQAIVDILVKEARQEFDHENSGPNPVDGEEGSLVLAVPGHPLVAERTVEILRDRAKAESITVEIIPAMSGVEAVYASLGIDPTRGLCILDGLALDEHLPRPDLANLILQVYNPRVASEVKLSLMEYYPDDFKVWVVRAAGVPQEEKMIEVPLYELDRLPWIDHLTSLYLPPQPRAESKPKPEPGYPEAEFPLDPLVKVMDALLGPGGCPWDREQTHQSLRPYLIEETYEVIEALDDGDMDKLADELGDLLLQIVFHAALAREREYFDINDVILKITQKMIRRHPHVFGEEKVESAGEVLVNWEQIKRQEVKEANAYLSGIPRMLPALLRAQKVQAKAARVGFDWPSIEGAWEKVKEELRELEEAQLNGSHSQKFEELGDLLFAVVNLARFYGVDSETALTRTIDKFIRRFGYIEAKAIKEGRSLLQLTLKEMDQWWEEAKHKE
ncbi:MAG: nucleoside triphosphate pyrophosphohydrolase [Bacillota bacterium]|jgi:tetrapyrrole methylase family protein/MazG family protein